MSDQAAKSIQTPIGVFIANHNGDTGYYETSLQTSKQVTFLRIKCI